MTDNSNEQASGKKSREPCLAESLVHANQELRASIVANVITKGIIGVGVGIGLGLLVFKRKVAPVMFTTGFGLGMSYAEGSQMVRDYHETIRKRALERGNLIERNPPTPSPPFTPPEL